MKVAVFQHSCEAFQHFYVLSLGVLFQGQIVGVVSGVGFHGEMAGLVTKLLYEDLMHNQTIVVAMRVNQLSNCKLFTVLTDLEDPVTNIHAVGGLGRRTIVDRCHLDISVVRYTGSVRVVLVTIVDTVDENCITEQSEAKMTVA